MKTYEMLLHGNNLYIMLGMLVIVSLYILRRFLTYWKNKKADKNILENIQPTVNINPVSYDLFTKIINEKCLFYLNQLGDPAEVEKEKLIQITEIFVKDAIKTLGRPLVSEMFAIYNADNFELLLKQKFLNMVYSLDQKLSNTQNVLEGELVNAQ